MARKAKDTRIILASSSRTRHHMLQTAGLACLVIPPAVDEQALRQEMKKEKVPVKPHDMARRLAAAKASAVSAQYPGPLVIGSDQVLAFGDEIITKPRSETEARKTLGRLRGKEHHLHSAVALARGGAVDWIEGDTALLVMRKFSPTFIDAYITRGGADICQSVGAYQIEGLGIQLFERVEGDHFTILGMPLLPLLAELRRRKVLLS